MTERHITLHTSRDAYNKDSVRRTMTVGDLISFLEDFDEDRKIYLSFDNGYTFGGVTEEQFEMSEDEEEDE